MDANAVFATAPFWTWIIGVAVGLVFYYHVNQAIRKDRVDKKFEAQANAFGDSLEKQKAELASQFKEDIDRAIERNDANFVRLLDFQQELRKEMHELNAELRAKGETVAVLAERVNHQ